ncbi:MAG: type I methionyl aminopeptidase [Bacteroidetes bacterium]|nr:MAG: type I methionyl aminopeptidase [Bacteroidota bacterium]
MSVGKPILKSPEEIEILRKNNVLVARTLAEIAPKVRPGVKTIELDRLAEEFIRDNGALPGFKGYQGFPYTLCISVNDAVVHGFPSSYELKEGDIASIDCGTILEGFFGDSAFTFPVGEISDEAQKLLDRTRESLERGIGAIRKGARTGDIGHAVQSYVESFGYGVVREMVGHGLGRTMHEAPEVPNYGRRGHGKTLQPGMVICIEPMITAGKRRIYSDSDGWTIRTTDGSLAAHFEKAVAVLPDGTADVLTPYDEIDVALGNK